MTQRFAPSQQALLFRRLIRQVSGAVPANVAGETPVESFSGEFPVDRVSGDWPLARTAGSLSSEKVSGTFPAERITGDWPLDRVSGSLDAARLSGSLPAGAIPDGYVTEDMLAPGVTQVIQQIVSGELVCGGNSSADAEFSPTDASKCVLIVQSIDSNDSTAATSVFLVEDGSPATWRVRAVDRGLAGRSIKIRYQVVEFA